eukprot:TRINITY_DN19221_c0_g1_i3.p1 TRINITY_DN19221_c0_g1~~TRINITY_DN19221_c0_g1_i3.p1  ORF type:complete len:324 (+),score=45.08 TRINITY_DN19221_c0_g1_i3:110-1081(+)
MSASLEVNATAAMDPDSEDLLPVSDSETNVAPQHTGRRRFALAGLVAAGLAGAALLVRGGGRRSAPAATAAVPNGDVRAGFSELYATIPYSVKHQCTGAYDHCKAVGLVPSCKAMLRAVITYQKPIPSEEDIYTFWKYIDYNDGCVYRNPRCTASYGSFVGAGNCCKQPGTVELQEAICPQWSPVCVGYEHGKHRGVCVEANKTVGWDDGNTLKCQNTPNWNNRYGFSKCFPGSTTDQRLCAPGVAGTGDVGGWTCAGYVKNSWCTGGHVVHWNGPKQPGGYEMNFPERHCCACGGGTKTQAVGAVARPVALTSPASAWSAQR